jgi:CDP-diacylglycerol--serine O-phosphatidyltransferase
MKKHIPNMITCCNLISGCVAVTFALQGNLKTALLWIIIGAVFDFFDGMVARLLHVSSPIGKELDSLADDVTFGVAPASIVFYELGVIDYPALLEPWRTYIPFVAFLIAAFSALRLAKFNLDERQTTSFIGLPTPANALFWGSLLAGMPQLIESQGVNGFYILLVMIVLSSWLLVAELPMFALKFKHWGFKGNEVKYGFIAISAALLTIVGIIEGFWLVILLYVVTSVILSLTGKSSSKNS